MPWSVMSFLCWQIYNSLNDDLVITKSKISFNASKLTWREHISILRLFTIQFINDYPSLFWMLKVTTEWIPLTICSQSHSKMASKWAPDTKQTEMQYGQYWFKAPFIRQLWSWNLTNKWRRRNKFTCALTYTNGAQHGTNFTK